MQLNNLHLKVILDLLNQLQGEVISLNEQIRTLTEANHRLTQARDTEQAHGSSVSNGHHATPAVVQE